MPNIKFIIQKHNKRTMNMHKKILQVTSNLMRLNDVMAVTVLVIIFSRLQNICQIKKVIYKATVIYVKETKYYIGSTGNTFKNRWYGQNNNIKNINENETELSKYIWKLINNNIEYNIKLSIIHYIGEENKNSREHAAHATGKDGNCQSK